MRIAWMAILALPHGADIVPPGYKSVRHEIVVEATALLDGYRLIAAPTHGFGVRAVATGELFACSSKYGTRLWLAPADAAVPSSHEDPVFDDWPRSDVFAEVATAPAGSPLASILTTYRITDVTGKSVCVELVDEARFDASGRPLSATASWILWLVAALGLAGLYWLWRRRPAPEPTP